MFGEPIEQTDQTGDKSKTVTVYDLLGRAQSQTKKNGWESLAYKYDEAGNLLQIDDTVYPLWYADGKVQPASASVTRTTKSYFGYDALNRQISETDTYWSEQSPSGHTTRHWYDALGRVEATQGRDGKTRWFGYDAVGRQVVESWGTTGAPQKTGGLFNPVGTADIKDATVIATYTDAADRVTYSFQAKTTLTPNASDGRFVFLKPTAGATWTVAPYTWTRFDYDTVGRIKTESTKGVTLTYRSDAAGRLLAVTDGQGGGQTSDYDRAGRVTARTMSNGKGQGAYFSFDRPGGSTWRGDRVKMITGRKTASSTGAQVVQAKIEFDYMGREKARAWTVSGGPQSGQKIEELKTIYDQYGNVREEERLGMAPGLDEANWGFDLTARYTHDKFNQVEKQENRVARNSWRTVSETKHDASGNGPYASKDEATKTGNRVSRQGDYKLGYDGQDYPGTGTAGNVTRQVYQLAGSNLIAEVWTLEYDTRNRLVSATRKNGSGGRQPEFRINYVYDTFDRLVARDETGNLNETNLSDKATRYVHAGGQPYADATSGGTITARYLFGPSDQPLARLMSGADGPDFYLTDRQDSVIQIVSAGGTALKRLKYDGLKAERRGPAASDRFELGGQMYDGRSELSLLGGQWYDPAIGRYLTEGGRGIGLNPYPVAGNNWPNEGAANGSSGRQASDDWLKSSSQRAREHTIGWIYDRLDGLLSDGSERERKEVVTTFSGLWEAAEKLRNPINPLDLIEGFAPRDARNGEISFRAAVDHDREAVTRIGHTIQTNYNGFRESGDGRATATFNTFTTIGPTGFVFHTMEAYEGESYQGASLGRKLTTGERMVSAANAGVGAYQFVGQVAAAVMTVGGSTVATSASALGGVVRRAAPSGLGRSMWSAVEVVGNAVGVPTPGQVAGLARGGAAMGTVARAGAYRATNASLDRVVHGWMSNSRYHNGTADFLNRLGFKVCFAAGTPLRTPDGWRNIEDIVAGSLVLARDEHDLEGAVVAKVVEEVFRREGLLTRLRVNGRDILTTDEHPFFVAGRGWVPCNQLKVGDQLATEGGAWVAVEAVEDTGEWAAVYNLRVADYHTYFVGKDEWGFSVWAHNADCVIEVHGNRRLVRDINTREVLFEGTWAEVAAFAQDSVQAGRHTFTGTVAGVNPVLASRLHGTRLDGLIEGAKPSRQGRNVQEHVYTNPGRHDPNRSPGTNMGYDKVKEVLPPNHAELFEQSVVIAKGGRYVRIAQEAMPDGTVRYHRFSQHLDNVFHWNGSTNGVTNTGVPRSLTIGKDLPSSPELKRLFGS